jgi:hypothetical protein
VEDSTIFFVGLGVVVFVMAAIATTLRAACVAVRTETRIENSRSGNTDPNR